MKVYRIREEIWSSGNKWYIVEVKKFFGWKQLSSCATEDGAKLAIERFKAGLKKTII